MKRRLLYLLLGIVGLCAAYWLFVTYVVVLTPQQPQFHSPSGKPIPRS